MCSILPPWARLPRDLLRRWTQGLYRLPDPDLDEVVLVGIVYSSMFRPNALWAALLQGLAYLVIK
jgi:hypothetical protein